MLNWKLALGLSFFVFCVRGLVVKPDLHGYATMQKTGADYDAGLDSHEDTEQPKTLVRSKRHTLLGCSWPKTHFTWFFVNRSMPQYEEVKAALRDSFAVWERGTPLRFREVFSLDADIKFYFHSDVYVPDADTKFDGPGEALAHAFSNSGPMRGQVHFDADESWSYTPTNNPKFTYLGAVAVHELGHVFGLDHWQHDGSIMSKSYQDIDMSAPLPEHDLAAIRSLYGDKSKPSCKSAELPYAPTGTQKFTKDSVLYSEPEPAPSLDICLVSYDALVRFYGELFIFTGKYVWRSYEPTRFKKITEFWPGLPHDLSSIDVAFVDSKHRLNIFIGPNIYIFRGQQLDEVRKLSELRLSPMPSHVDAIFHYDVLNKTVVLSGTNCWLVANRIVSVCSSRDLFGLTNPVDTVFQDKNGELYFFKGQHYSGLQKGAATMKQTRSKFSEERWPCDGLEWISVTVPRPSCCKG